MSINQLMDYAKHLTVLCVEDESELRESIEQLLKMFFKNVDCVESGQEALKVYEKGKYNIVITDVNMPGINGVELIEELRQKFPEQKVVVMSGHNESTMLMDLIQAGVHNFLMKPITQKDLIKTLYPVCRDAYFQYLNVEEIIRLNEEIIETQKEVIVTMGAIGEQRSKETGMHVKRVAESSYLLAKLYGLDEEEAQQIKMASPMHDIGKVGIPDDILNKPGKLDDDEWKIMRTHSMLGYEMLKSSKRPLLKAAAMIAKEHHEKWDGSGYPEGKKGEDIHIYGRITAVADVFDALAFDRIYKKAWEMEDIFSYFKEESGKHFDPALVELFFENVDQFLEIKEQLS